MPGTYQYDFFNVTFPAEYVAVVEINRAEKMNAFKEIMWLNLSKIFTKLSVDPDVRAVILTGAGDKAFTAGLDVQAASSGPIMSGDSDAARNAHKIRDHILEFQSCITTIETCSKPVIALLHGISFGLALDLSLAADIRYATSSAKLSIKEVDIGLAADIGTLTRIVHAGVPMSWAKEAALTARIFSGAEAKNVGIVSATVETKAELLAKGIETAKLIASKSPVAVVGTKMLMNYSRGRSVADGLDYTATWNMAMLQTNDMKEALMAGLKKTKVSFAKL